MPVPLFCSLSPVGQQPNPPSPSTPVHSPCPGSPGLQLWEATLVHTLLSTPSACRPGSNSQLPTYEVGNGPHTCPAQFFPVPSVNRLLLTASLSGLHTLHPS